jgi:hypothetical protein
MATGMRQLGPEPRLRAALSAFAEQVHDVTALLYRTMLAC